MVFTGIVTIIGAPRDYFIAAMFPKWMVFAPGMAPILADTATYFGAVVLGHVVMRLIAGPASRDRLTRCRPETSQLKMKTPSKLLKGINQNNSMISVAHSFASCRKFSFAGCILRM
jgi:hypothetical protein